MVVIYGSRNDGLTATSTSVPAPQYWSQRTTGVPGANEACDRFGTALAAGDFNGDGYSDLAIGVPGENITTNDRDIFGNPIVLANLGGVVVIYGSRHGLTTSDPNVPPARYFDLTMANRIFPDPYFGDMFLTMREGAKLGQSLAWGDFNGDGFGDLAIGAPSFSVEAELAGGFPVKENPTVENPTVGAVWTLYGHDRLNGLTTTGNRLWLQRFGGSNWETGAGFGSALTSGNFNGDVSPGGFPYSDLAVGSPDKTALAKFVDRAGEVDVIYGSSAGLSETGWQVFTQVLDYPERDDRFGASLAAGDFNGDGRSDLAVGVPGEDLLGVIDAGAVNVFYGRGTTGLTTTGSQLWNQNAIFGAGHNEAGDVITAHRTADLAIGVPGEDIGSVVNAGAVNVIYGSWSGYGLVSANSQWWDQSSTGIPGSPEYGDNFGAAMY